MKSFFSYTTATLLALSAHVARGHYTFPDFQGDAASVADWQYVRMTQNHYSQGPVTDVTDPLLRCYENDTASATSTTTATAGNTYSFGADQAIYHPGYTAVYMAQVSDLTSESAGDGSVWFKIFEDAPVYDASLSDFYVFPDETATSVTFTIPKALPSGNYLIRVEQIALHVASSYGGAQFYIGCAQVQVTGGGSGSPSPLVAIPGVYTGYEPGILINIYEANPNGTYISPGPAVWTGSGSTGGSSTTTAKTSSTTAKTTSSSTTAKTSTTTLKTTATSTTSSASSTATGTVAEYGQCGGIGYTGSTVCASPYTCTYSNAYYSQCL